MILSLQPPQLLLAACGTTQMNYIAITSFSPPVPLSPSPPLPQGPEQLQTSQFGGNNCSGCKMCMSMIHFANVPSLRELFATGLICPSAFISATHSSSLAIVANANLPELEKQCQFCSTNDCHRNMKPISLMYRVH